MADQASLQARIWKGYAQAALRLGTDCIFYRLNGGIYPDYELFTRPVSLNAEDMKYARPNKYGKATWYALFDAADVQPGDYFKGPQGTFFIAGIQPLLPILVVECNRTVSIARAQAADDLSAPAYGGMTKQNETAIATNVPCSILQGTKGAENEVKLPADTRLPWWTILMPAACSVMYGDTLTDELGNRYIVSSAELTSLGYRLTAMLAAA